jgi:hypothetical protein
VDHSMNRLLSRIAASLLAVAILLLFGAIPLLLLANGILDAIMEPRRLLMPGLWFVLVFVAAMFSFAVWAAKGLLNAKINCAVSWRATIGLGLLMALGAFAVSPWWEQVILYAIVSGGVCFGVGLLLAEMTTPR